MNFELFANQLRDTATKVSTYLKDVSTYLSTGVGIPPSFEEVLETTSTDILEETSQLIRMAANGTSSGVITTALYDNNSMSRESSMGLKNKSQIYTDEALDLNLASDEVQAEVMRKLNYIQGRSPDQGLTL